MAIYNKTHNIINKLLENQNEPDLQIKKGQFWYTRSGEIAKITRILAPEENHSISEQPASKQHHIFLVIGRVGKGSNFTSWTRSGRVFSELVDDEYDLINRIPNKKKW